MKNTELSEVVARLKEVAGLTHAPSGLSESPESHAKRMEKFAKEAARVLNQKGILHQELNLDHKAQKEFDADWAWVTGTAVPVPGRAAVAITFVHDKTGKKIPAKEFDEGWGWNTTLGVAVVKALSGLGKQHSATMRPGKNDTESWDKTLNAKVEGDAVVYEFSFTDSGVASILDKKELTQRINDALKVVDKRIYYFTYSYGEHVSGNGWDEPEEYDEQDGELVVEVSLGDLLTDDDGKSYVLNVDVDYEGLVSHNREVKWADGEHDAIGEFYTELEAALQQALPEISVEIGDSDTDGRKGTGWVAFDLTAP